MCGRYAETREPGDLARIFRVPENRLDPALPPDWNMAPTKLAPVVIARPPRDDRDAEPVRQLRALRWGLVPSWAKDPSIGSRLINARAETVMEKPAFRKAFATRRALVPADGFYEWLPTGEIGKGGKLLKQPYFIHRADDQPLAFAGIYEFWRDRSLPDDADDAWLVTYSIVTTTATDDVGRIHDRMPMTVAEDRWTDWLDPRVPAEAAHLLMAPPVTGSLDIYPVSTAVNSVANNGPELVDPVQP